MICGSYYLNSHIEKSTNLKIKNFDLIGHSQAHNDASPKREKWDGEEQLVDNINNNFDKLG